MDEMLLKATIISHCHKVVGRCSRSLPIDNGVRSLYLTMFQAIGAIGIVYELAPPSLEDLTHLAVSGLVDSLNEVWREGTDLVSVTRGLGLYWGHTLYVRR